MRFWFFVRIANCKQELLEFKAQFFNFSILSLSLSLEIFRSKPP